MDEVPFGPLTGSLLAFHQLWQSKCAGERLPARADFSLQELRPFMGNVAILDVIDGGADFRFRLYGSGIAESYQGDMTGKSVREYRPEFFDRLAPGYRDCIARRAPRFDRFEVDDSRMLFRWARVVLPLASDGHHVDMLMVLVHRQVYQPRGDA